MSDTDRGSVTHWLGPLRAGDEEAASRLRARYFAGLVRLARARLGTTPRGAADVGDVDQIRRDRRRKRGGRAGGESEAPARVAGDEPTPEFAALMAEQYLHPPGRLPDEALPASGFGGWRATPTRGSPPGWAAVGAPSIGSWG
jgi:hypothetical protein